MDANLTSLFAAVEADDGSAAESLFAALYAELHRLARRELARAGPQATLCATSLLHQAYIDISQREASFPDRNRFMAYAARVMRGLIIDYVRHRRAQKRGGSFELTALSTDVAESSPLADTDRLQEISDALDVLAAVDATLAETVDLKFFCGFSFVEIAGIQGVSDRTVQRNWQKARVFLHRTIRDGQLDA